MKPEFGRSAGNNSGFSLIELVITVAVLTILSGMVFIGTGDFRRKETDKFANLLCSQIRLMQTATMAKAGNWRLCLYEKDGRYYCVQETARSGETAEDITWEEASERVMLGYSGAVTYEERSKTLAASGDETEGLIRVWRFNRDTGSCIEGAGTLRLTGPGKTIEITVYRENGRVESALAE